MKRVLVIDADNLIVRCVMASALDDLQAVTPEGVQFTGGIYGALNSLAQVVRLTTPNQIVAFFDNGVPKERMRLLPDYKSKRKDSREMMSEEDMNKAYGQIPECWNIWPTLGIQCLSYKYREADDGVAAAARILVEHGREAIVVSGDKDLWQCVGYGASVWNNRLAADATRLDPLLTAATFEDDAGVPVGLYVVYRTLCGDASDSIAGAPGVGPKRARGILADLRESWEAPLFPKSIEEMSPREQLDGLVTVLKAKKKLRAFEQSVLDSYAHLCDVIPAIDLRHSFGGTKSLARHVLHESGTVDRTGFLRHCVRLKFQSILGDPDNWLGPFTRANRSRDAVRQVARPS